MNIRKNGVLVGTVFKDVKSPVIPTVAVHSQGEEYVSFQIFCFAPLFVIFFLLRLLFFFFFLNAMVGLLMLLLFHI